jgi:hypothetical protein
MDDARVGLAFLLVSLYFIVWIIRVLLRVPWWWTPVIVLVLIGSPLLATGIWPLPFIWFNIWFFLIAGRWESLGSYYRTPKWPRVPFRRGPGRRRPRDFREPLPWSRGPCSY